VAQPAVDADQQRPRLPDAAAVQRHRPQPLAPQRGRVERPAGDGRPARRRLRRRPGHHRVAEAVASPVPLDLRPAVVAAAFHQVDLVDAVLAELGGEQPPVGVPGQPLHVAVAEAPDRRAGERVAVGHAAVGAQPQDLAAEAARVLGVTAVGGVAGAGVEHPVRAEGDAAAVVDGGPWDAGDQHLRRLADAEADDAVVVAGAEVGVHEPVAPVVGGDGHPQQPALAARGDPGHGGDLLGFGARPHPQDPPAVPLGDERAAVGQEREPPWCLQVAGDRLGRSEPGADPPFPARVVLPQAGHHPAAGQQPQREQGGGQPGTGRAEVRHLAPILPEGRA
jgi:hypothetical protein